MANLFPHIPHLALTATATKKTQHKIIDVLQLREPLMVEISPNRSNICFEARERPARGGDKLVPILNPIIEELKQKKANTELTLIYGNLETCAECFMIFSSALREEQYFPQGAAPIAENRLFAQYHAEYPAHEMERLVNEMVKGKCKTRVLFVTIAFGMGIDIPNIRAVIHIGVPHTMEEYFQEAGRAGRDGEPSVAKIFYNSYDIMKRKNGIDEVMREFATTKECRRKMILNYFGHELPPQISHTCCDNDRASCECADCLSAITENLESISLESATQQTTSSDVELQECFTYNFSATAKKKIRAELESYRSSLYLGKTCVGGITLGSGFSLQLIEQTMEYCEEMTSIEIIQDTLPVFSKKNAEVIFGIVYV